MRHNILRKISIYFYITCQYISFTSFAQDNSVTRNDTTEFIKFESLANEIEKTYNVKLFYKPEWFGNKLFRKSFTELPLEECLSNVKHIAELNCIPINLKSYVFVPWEIRNFSNNTNNKGVLIIGEQSEFGKKNTAIVTGKISDAKTGKPLYGAILSISKLNLNVFTDKEGNYKFTVPAGEYDLFINYVGFEENDRKISVGGDGVVDFSISEKTIKLKEIVFSDKAANLNIVSSQMSTTRLNTKMIKELPLFLGEKDVIKSVKLLPGVQSTGEFGTGFFVRGGSSDQNLILVEDVPLFNSSHVFGLISAINSDGVSNITLLKSGIPAKYGERASSVMDIRMGNKVDKLSCKGGIGLMDTRLNLEVPLFNKKVSLLLGGRTSYSNWLLHAMPDVELKNSSASFYDMNAMLAAKINANNNITFYGYFSNDNFSFTKTSPYHYDNTLASIQYEHKFSEKLKSGFLLGMSRYRNDMSENDTLKLNEAYKISSTINYYNTKINFNWLPDEKHTIDFGMNAMLYKYNLVR